MTAGSPAVAPIDRWTLTVAVEAEDMSVSTAAVWDIGAFRALPVQEITCDIHCVTRWSKLDTRWRGVAIDDILAAAGLAHDAAALRLETDARATEPSALPHRYVSAECDGDYTANLRLSDLLGGAGFVVLDYDAGEGWAPIVEDHGGPARLLVPRLYFWKSAKWLRRLVFTPYDRKGYWEKLGYHNYGDPWREQRYRGLSDGDHRTTLDPDLSRRIRSARRSGRSTRD